MVNGKSDGWGSSPRVGDTKVTPALRAEICRRAAAGESTRTIATDLGVSQRSVQRVLSEEGTREGDECTGDDAETRPRRVFRAEYAQSAPLAALKEQLEAVKVRAQIEAIESDPNVRDALIDQLIGPRKRELTAETIDQARHFLSGQGLAIVPATEVVELRERAARLAQGASARDLDRCRQSLAELAGTCNRCHQSFRVPVRITPFAAE